MNWRAHVACLIETEGRHRQLRTR